MRVLVLLYITSCLCFSCVEKEDTVSTSKRQILVNGQSFVIKGICYHPVPKGSNKRSFETLHQDLALMQEAHINTIRVYEPIDDIAVLDAIHQAKMKVIIGFGYDQGGLFDIKSGTFINYVNTYKIHPAILMWELGNEYNYHPEWFQNDIKNWYNALHKASQLIHKHDTKHPVTTAHGELPDALALSICTEIDVWGMNIYRWDNPKALFDEWKAVSKKPMYFSEAGADSYMTITKAGYQQGINEKAQAQANMNILEALFKNKKLCSGVTLFSFTDGWWKAGNNTSQDIGGWAPNSSGIPYDGTPNEEFWGIVDIDRNKKKTFFTVKTLYGKN